MKKLVYGFDRLHSNCELSENLVLMSRNQAYFSILKTDGNLSIFKSAHFISKNIVWTTKNKNQGEHPYKLKLLETGILQINDKNGYLIWASSEFQKGNGPYQLIMQDDGNLVIYDGNGKPQWCKKEFDI